MRVVDPLKQQKRLDEFVKDFDAAAPAVRVVPPPTDEIPVSVPSSSTVVEMSLPTIPVVGGELVDVSKAENVPDSGLEARDVAPGRLALARNKSGDPWSNLDNAMRILEHIHYFAGSFHYDEFACRIMSNWPTGVEQEWRDDLDNQVALLMQRSFRLVSISPTDVYRAVQVLARRVVRNPVTSYLDSLTWDGIGRIENLLSDGFGVEETPYTLAVSRNVLISMVARAYEPGCKADNMLVLEGPQGIGKSEGVAALGGPWFAECSEDPRDKDFSQALQGKWIIEVAELDSFNKAEVTAVKRVLSCREDRYRPSYGRATLDHPRRCIFVGTTNRDDWQRDETGGRRFWPVRVKGVDLGYIREHRDQLFAEAVHRFKGGESWWEVPEFEARAEQEARRAGHPWESPIATFIEKKKSVTVNDLLECLGVEMARRGKREEMQVASCLKILGWVRKDGRLDGRKAKFWVPGWEAGNSEVTQQLDMSLVPTFPPDSETCW